MKLPLRPVSLVFLLLLLPAGAFAFGDSQDVLGFGHLYLGGRYNDIWGFEKNGREYAVIGQDTACVFIDVTKPTNPIVIKSIGRPFSVWGSVKRYGNTIYYSTENPADGLKIIDITNPQNPTLIRTWNTTFTNAHNVWVDTTAARLYAVGTGNGMRVLNLATNPTNPTDVGGYTSTYIHDIYVRNNVGYAGCINAGQLRILNVTNPAAISLIGSVGYPGGATHNAWPTEDGAYCFTTDETNGGHIRVWDIQPPSSPIQVADAYANTNTSIVHNVFIKGDSCHTAYYTDGYQLHDISDPENPVLVGWYDTSDQAGPSYKGAWSAYPYLPSGNVLVSSLGEGFFVVRPCGKLNQESGWPTSLPGPITGAVTLADLDGDGSSEVLAGSASDSVTVFTGDGGAFPGWPRAAGGDVTGSVAVGDLTGDGDLEIVAGDLSGSLRAWEHTGALVSGWPVATGAAIEGTPVLANLAGDASLEVVVASGGMLRAFTAGGSPIAGFPVALSGTLGACGAAVGDLDGDGSPEILQATLTTLHAFHANGAVVAGWPKATAAATSSLRRAPILADLDGDSDLEVLIGAGSGAGSVAAFHGDGSAVAGWPRATPAECGGALAAGDLDGNGVTDVVAVAANGLVYAWSGAGVGLTGWPVGGAGSLGSAPLVVDLDGDGSAEVLAATADSTLRIYHGNGLPMYPCQPDLEQAVEGGIALGKSDADGFPELFLPLRGGKIGAFSLQDVGATTSRRDWPGYRFGNRRLGVRENTFPGGDVAVLLGNGGVIAVFDSVRSEGYTQLRVNPAGLPPVPLRYRAFGDSVAYHLTTSAAILDSVTVTLPYDATGLTLSQENAIVMLHASGGDWSVVTVSRDTGANTATGRGVAPGYYALFIDNPTGVTSDPTRGGLAFRLAPASPNPTRAGSLFRLTVPYATDARLDLFDASGARVTTLVEGRLPAGTHAVAWDGASGAGAPLASGVYFYRFEAGPFVETRKLTILR